MAMNVRKKKVSDAGLQMRLVAIFGFLGCVAALFQVLLTNRSLIGLAKQLKTDGDVVMAALPGVLIGNVLWTLAILVPLMLVVGVLVTHRIAGPIYRFQTYLEAVARGEDPGPCRIRKEDELHELCERINHAVAALREGSAADERVESPERRTAA